MLRAVGYLAVVLGLMMLYRNELFAGLVVFSVGGLLARRLYFSPSSAGLLLLLGSSAFGFHHGFSLLLGLLMLLGFVMAGLSGGRSRAGEWGFDLGWQFHDLLGSGSDDSGEGGGGD